MKKLLTRGLINILKQNRSWCPNRQDLGAITAEDKVTLLSQEIEDCIQEQKVVHAVWIDLQKAFDKVWKDGLLIKWNNIANVIMDTLIPPQLNNETQCHWPQ